MPNKKKRIVVPASVFHEYMSKGVSYDGFVSYPDGRSVAVVSQYTVSTPQTNDLSVKPMYSVKPVVKYNICAIPYLPNDATRVYMPPVLLPHKNSRFLHDPIKGIDRGAVENATHLVKEGDTIESISRQYGVSTYHLKKINGEKEPTVGIYYNVFPEVMFSNNPYGGYQNPSGGSGLIYDSDTVFELVVDFLIGGDGTCGARLENMVIRGGATAQIADWDVVQDLVEEGRKVLIKNNCKPGTVYENGYRPLPILALKNGYIQENLTNKIKRELLNDTSVKNRDFFSPVHYIGSFGFSMRMNADGVTATVAVYDTNSIASLTDNKLGKNSNNNGSNTRILETTYQRYIWVVLVEK